MGHQIIPLDKPVLGIDGDPVVHSPWYGLNDGHPLLRQRL